MDFKIQWTDEQQHPLLNDLILETLMLYIHSQDLPSCRLTCIKWLHFVNSRSRFRRDFAVDLTGDGNAASRKITRFICAMGKRSKEYDLPFEAFKLSETRLGLVAIDRVFFTTFTPYFKKLTLITKNSTILNFIKIIKSLDCCKTLELSLNYGITASEQLKTLINGDKFLPQLKHLKWLKQFQSSNDDGQEMFSVHFLENFYSALKSLESVEFCTREVWKHLVVMKNLKRYFGVSKMKFQIPIGRTEIDVLLELSEVGLCLEELEMKAFRSDIRGDGLNKFLEIQAPYLNILGIGWISKHRVDDLLIRIPRYMLKLRKISLGLSTKIRYERLNLEMDFRNLQELSLTLKNEKGPVSSHERTHFVEDILQIGNDPCPILSLYRLKFQGVPIRYVDTLCSLHRLFPSVRSLTLGRPNKNMLTELWMLWPYLKELKILFACSHIDEVLCGITTDNEIILERFTFKKNTLECCPTEISGEIVPSIKNLKYLQRLEINSDMSEDGFLSLSGLPSDVAIHMAFMKMPELRFVRIHRSLISPEAAFELESKFPPWGCVEIKQIQLEFDEEIDAFQFHRRNQQFMKLLCQYPHKNLKEFPSFLTSMWMEGRLQL